VRNPGFTVVSARLPRPPRRAPPATPAPADRSPSATRTPASASARHARASSAE